MSGRENIRTVIEPLGGSTRTSHQTKSSGFGTPLIATI
jgi:hypothetical protein